MVPCLVYIKIKINQEKTFQISNSRSCVRMFPNQPGRPQAVLLKVLLYSEAASAHSLDAQPVLYIIYKLLESL
jgi:hypothetical protein